MLAVSASEYVEVHLQRCRPEPPVTTIVSQKRTYLYNMKNQSLLRDEQKLTPSNIVCLQIHEHEMYLPELTPGQFPKHSQHSHISSAEHDSLTGPLVGPRLRIRLKLLPVGATQRQAELEVIILQVDVGLDNRTGNIVLWSTHASMFLHECFHIVICFVIEAAQREDDMVLPRPHFHLLTPRRQHRSQAPATGAQSIFQVTLASALKKIIFPADSNRRGFRLCASLSLMNVSPLDPAVCLIFENVRSTSVR